jgi:hypothetical protein
MRRGADRGEQVLHEREVEHLLLRDGENDVAPAVDRLELPGGEALIDSLLHGERGEEVLAQDRVLELRRFSQQ